jgi:acylphosphatase
MPSKSSDSRPKGWIWGHQEAKFAAALEKLLPFGGEWSSIYPQTMPIAKHIFYTGRVQGVGFRYTTKQLALGFDISGFVRNLPDGRVELFVQSFEPEELFGFLEELEENSSLSNHIKEKEAHRATPDLNIKGFSISN